MVNFYNKEYVDTLKNKKKLHLLLNIGILSLMIITNVVLVIIFSGYPYGSGMKTTFLIISYVITIIFTFLAGMYYEILYLPVRNHYIKVIEVLLGKKEKLTVTVLRMNDEVLDKLSVKFKSFDVVAWSEIQNDYVERTILYDCDYEINFNANQMVEVITCGNILLGYEEK